MSNAALREMVAKKAIAGILAGALLVGGIAYNSTYDRKRENLKRAADFLTHHRGIIHAVARLRYNTDSEPARSNLEEKVSGSLSFVSSGNSTPVGVLNVYGTPYEMGYTQGTLLKSQVRENIRNMMDVVFLLDGPKDLDEGYKQLEPFIPQEYKDEMQGLADASGVDINLIHWMHAVPEIHEHHCSGYAILKNASGDGHTEHIRSLDFATFFGVQDHPVIVIYHPKNGLQYANPTWAGFIGSVGGVNESRVAIGEISGGSTTPDEAERLDGIPFPFLFRQILERAHNLAEAEDVARNARRTNKYVYVFSDPSNADVIMTGPKTFDPAPAGTVCHTMPKSKQEFPSFPGIAYYGHYHKVLHDDLDSELKKGGVTLQDVFSDNKRVAMNDNLQVWVFQHDTMKLWLANAKGFDGKAADQPYVQVDLGRYFR